MERRSARLAPFGSKRTIASRALCTPRSMRTMARFLMKLSLLTAGSFLVGS